MIKGILIALAVALGLIEFPVVAAPVSIHVENEEQEWAEFHALSYAEHADAFTALFNAMEYKVSKNGRSMIRRPGDKSFRFVKSA